MILKRKFAVELVCLFTIVALLFTGCSKMGKNANNLRSENNSTQTSNPTTDGSTSTTKTNAKTITDSDLLKTVSEDSTVELDSVYDNSQELSKDEIDTLLNDNNDLDNLPSNYNVKQ